MDLNHCNYRFTTQSFEDGQQGCIGLDLYRTKDGLDVHVGRITFWDADGQFSADCFNMELPLDVLEKFIAEARQTILIE